jgi:hypothetical protein
MARPNARLTIVTWASPGSPVAVWRSLVGVLAVMVYFAVVWHGLP